LVLKLNPGHWRGKEQSKVNHHNFANVRHKWVNGNMDA